MKILVTGGNGYVSRNISNKLRNVGHDVLSPYRQELDMTNLDEVKRYFDIHQPEAVVHSASTGGYRDKPDTHEVLIVNVKMFDSLTQVVTTPRIPIVFYTSGADFDRRKSIEKVFEDEVIRRYPIDPYGLAKNLIVRQILQKDSELRYMNIVRIFAVFNEDEADFRFIKQSILNVKSGLPIIIHQNRQMDFIYMDDLFTLTEHFLKTPKTHQHINASYRQKVTLLDIANIICKYTAHLNPRIVIKDETMGLAYSGDWYRYSTFKLTTLGLDEGIRRTINKLL